MSFVVGQLVIQSTIYPAYNRMASPEGQFPTWAMDEEYKMLPCWQVARIPRHMTQESWPNLPEVHVMNTCNVSQIGSVLEWDAV